MTVATHLDLDTHIPQMGYLPAMGASYSRQPDPIMQELWAVKAQINKQCDYSVDKVFEMARSARLARLQKNVFN